MKGFLSILFVSCLLLSNYNPPPITQTFTEISYDGFTRVLDTYQWDGSKMIIRETLILDSDGTVISMISYDLFGNIINSQIEEIYNEYIYWAEICMPILIDGTIIDPGTNEYGKRDCKMWGDEIDARWQEETSNFDHKTKEEWSNRLGNTVAKIIQDSYPEHFDE